MLDYRTVFNTYVLPATMEMFTEQVRLFNESSAGALVLNADAFRGDFRTQAFFDNIMAAQRRVNRYGPNTEAPKTYITDHTQNEVKVAGGFGPVIFEPSELTWMHEPTGRSLEVAATNFSAALIYDQVNTALGAVLGAITSQPDAVYGNKAQQLTYDTINMAHSLFGAASSLLVADFMTGHQYHKFVSQNLANAPSLLVQAGNVRVVSILGKVTVVVDAEALQPVDGSARVLSLTRGAVTVSDSGDVITNVETTNGQQRIETSFQADYTFNLGVKGYSWDTATGGKSPMDPELFSGANWERVSSALQSTAGVLAIGS